ncbi:MAG: hypothetical protein GY820_00570 [Gammaproteobacteria bacterium]|nr:hypothetical protein [Gammaproteobacteria bacterium]
MTIRRGHFGARQFGARQFGARQFGADNSAWLQGCQKRSFNSFKGMHGSIAKYALHCIGIIGVALQTTSFQFRRAFNFMRAELSACALSTHNELNGVPIVFLILGIVCLCHAYFSGAAVVHFF